MSVAILKGVRDETGRFKARGKLGCTGEEDKVSEFRGLRLENRFFLRGANCESDVIFGFGCRATDKRWLGRTIVPGECTVSGIVRCDWGDAIENAWVSVIELEGGPVASGQSNSNGVYSIGVPAGAYLVSLVTPSGKALCSWSPAFVECTGSGVRRDFCACTPNCPPGPSGCAYPPNLLLSIAGAECSMIDGCDPPQDPDCVTGSYSCLQCIRQSDCEIDPCVQSSCRALNVPLTLTGTCGPWAGSHAVPVSGCVSSTRTISASITNVGSVYRMTIGGYGNYTFEMAISGLCPSPRGRYLPVSGPPEISSCSWYNWEVDVT